MLAPGAQGKQLAHVQGSAEQDPQRCWCPLQLVLLNAGMQVLSSTSGRGLAQIANDPAQCGLHDMHLCGKYCRESTAEGAEGVFPPARTMVAAGAEAYHQTSQPEQPLGYPSSQQLSSSSQRDMVPTATCPGTESS